MTTFDQLLQRIIRADKRQDWLEVTPAQFRAAARAMNSLRWQPLPSMAGMRLSICGVELLTPKMIRGRQ